MSGLPVDHFIAACNVNDAVPEYLRTGNYQSKKSVTTISNAMDVGNPSNFIRVLELFKNSYKSISEKISGYTVSDEITKQTIAEVYQKDHYILDPHGAVAYYALEDYLKSHQGKKGMILETAHPVKFPDTVEDVIGRSIEIPEAVKPLFQLEKKSVLMEPNFSDLKGWLLTQ